MRLRAVALAVSVWCGEAVPFWFGSGCFWGRQHDFIDFEQRILLRNNGNLTAAAAYAGGTEASELCYGGERSYTENGAAEVVVLDLEADDFAGAATVYFESFVALSGSEPPIYARADYADAGAQYRATVGLPGGLEGAFGAQLRAANFRNMTLVAGKGGDADTLGSGAVWVLDSEMFAAVQAEVCLQFHDEQGRPPYEAAYGALAKALLESGRLVETKCPQNAVCAEDAPRR